MTNKRLVLTILFGCLAIGVASEAAAEITIIKDSTAFEHYYEGGDPVIVVNKSTVSLDLANSGYAGSLGSSIMSSALGVLTITSDEGGDFFLENADWVAEADDAGGWTWEMRFKVDDLDTYGTVFSMNIGDGGGGNHVIANIGEDFIRLYGNGNPAVVENYDLKSDFHTLRIAQEANDGVTNFFMDSEYIYQFTQDWGGDHWIGGGGATIGGIVDVDYIRWTGLGGFAPVGVPEPSMLVFVADWRSCRHVASTFLTQLINSKAI